jgi:hypothetical protein
MRRNADAAEQNAVAETRRAAAAESMASEFTQHARRKRQDRSGLNQQPHVDDPNQAAINIDSNAKS